MKASIDHFQSAPSQMTKKNDLFLFFFKGYTQNMCLKNFLNSDIADKTHAARRTIRFLCPAVQNPISASDFSLLLL